MTDAIKLISGTSHPALAAEIAQHLGLPLCETEIHRFGNENILFQCKENVRESDVFVIQTSCPPVSDLLIELLIIIDALKHASARRITAVLPYLPYARSDKKDRPRISITARLVADLLETAGAHRVLTMNLHSPQVQGFFRIPVDQLNATPIVCDHLRATTNLAESVLVASDVGEAKDLGEYANRLKLPLAIIDKRRRDDTENPVAVGLIGDVRNRDALIIDDEIASGGTMIEAARFLRAKRRPTDRGRRGAPGIVGARRGASARLADRTTDRHQHDTAAPRRAARQGRSDQRCASVCRRDPRDSQR